MKSSFFKELQKYTRNEIEEKLGTTPTETSDLIKRLRANNIIKAIKPRKYDINKVEIDNEDIEISEFDINDITMRYVFDYVGIIVLNDIVIKCYPKYIINSDKNDTLKTITAVLRKYEEREKVIEGMSGWEEDSEFNLLSMTVFVITDFMENGIYSNQKDITSVNGEGEIDWDKTINETFAVLNNKKPMYLDLYTKNSIDDEEDYFRLLHMHIITKCSDILKETGLGEIFSLPIFEFKVDERLFSDKEFVLNKISRELNIQFVTRKQQLLKTMFAFISNSRISSNGYGLSLFGTKNFNLVWEKVCAFVLDNQLNKKLSSLNIKLNSEITSRYGSNTLLRELIEKPLWIPNCQKTIEHKANKTLMPDIISIYYKDSKKYFIISDAKYYTIRLNENVLEDNPGVEDVSKQYLYNLAYKDFIRIQKFDVTHNAFIFPSEDDRIELLGSAKMTLLETIGLDDIMVIKMPAQEIFRMYINNKKLDIANQVSFL